MGGRGAGARARMRRAVVLAAAAALSAAAALAAPAVEVGEPAPTVDAAQWVAGGDRVAEGQGRLRVLAFLPSAAVTNSAPLDALRELDGVYGPPGLRVQCVVRGTAADVRDLLSIFPQQFPVAADEAGTTCAAFGLAAGDAVPRAAIVAADGRIAWTGPLDASLRAAAEGAFSMPGGCRIDRAPRTPWAEASQRHAALATRPSFLLRVRGREALARSGDPRALANLSALYLRPDEPKDFTRWSLATMAATFLSDPGHDAAWAAWLAKCAADGDAWLWHRAAWADAPLDRGRRALAGMEEKSPFVAAASLRALENGPTDVALAAAAKTFAAPPADGVRRRLLVEAAAQVTSRHPGASRTEEARRCAEAMVGLLGDPQSADRTKAVLVQCLRRVLGSKEDSPDAAVWRAELEQWKLRQGAASPRPSAYAGPDFLGLPVRGERVCFVVDASNSMTEPVDAATLAKHRAAVTGRPAATGVGVAASSIDWSRVQTRIDLAREALRVAIERLPERTRFAVVLFGDTAAPMAATPALVAATPSNVRRVLAEIDSLAKHGAASKTLRGDTNLHGALRVAFALEATRKPDASYTSVRLLDEGCDAIYVLSDGAPNRDDWRVGDRRDDEDTSSAAGDGGLTGDSASLVMPGPYASMRGSRGAKSSLALRASSPSYLVDDVVRMNLFRAATIHCVGLSGADSELLRALARVGDGEHVTFE